MKELDFDSDIAQFIRSFRELEQHPGYRGEGDLDKAWTNIIDDLRNTAVRIYEQLSGKLVSIDMVKEKIASLLELENNHESDLSKGGPGGLVLYLIYKVADHRYKEFDDCKYTIWDMFEYFKATEEFGSVFAKKLERIEELPGFDPETWYGRKLELGPIIVRDSSIIPEFLDERFEEATSCYIYGNFLGGTALCRATLEAALKFKYPLFFESSQGKGFKEIVYFLWGNLKELREREDLLELADSIIDSGNRALHRRISDNSIHLFNEYTLLICLRNLKEILEFLFAKS